MQKDTIPGQRVGGRGYRCGNLSEIKGAGHEETPLPRNQMCFKGFSRGLIVAK